MTAVTASVVVSAPAQDAWEALTDWAGQGAWMPMTSVSVQAGDGALGTRLSARTGIGPLAVLDDMEIDVWDPPRRCEVAHHGRVIRGRGIFEVETLTATSSRVTWTEQLEGLPARLTAPISRWALGVALRRLARLAAAA